MADNLIELEQNVETFIDPSGVPGSILAQNHQNILKDVLAKVGKYVGSPYIATKEETNLLPGTMSWRGNAMNNTSLFQIDFAKLTADLNDFGLILSTLAEGDLIHFKDAKGRSVFLEYFNHNLTTGTSPVYQVNVKGKAENINYVYQDTEKLISIFQSYKQNTEAKEYEIQFIAPNFVLLEDGVPKTSIDLSVAITDTIQATETSLADFAVNSANYTFQQGDVISIVTTPDNVLELYLYKSGTKTDVNNYQKIDASKIDWSNILNKPLNLTKISVQDENGVEQFEVTDTLQIEGGVFDVPNKRIIVSAPIVVPRFGITELLQIGSDALGANVFTDADKLSIQRKGAVNSNPTVFEFLAQSWGGGGRRSKFEFSFQNGSTLYEQIIEFFYNLAVFNVNIEVPKIITDSGMEVDAEFANNVTNVLIKVNDPAGNNLSISNVLTSPNYRLEFKVGRGGAGWNSGYDFFVSDGLNPEFKILEMKSSNGGTSTLKGSFKADKFDLSALGSYADDATAGSNGVDVGFAYINSSTGAVHRRLT